MSPVIQQKKMEALQSAQHDGCVICGSENPDGLQLRFRVLPDGAVAAEFACLARYAGYAERLHGGITASLLDSAMTHCLFAAGEVAVTAELHVRYHAPVEIGCRAVVRAWLEKRSLRLSRVCAELRQAGQVRASAWGKFISPRPAAGKEAVHATSADHDRGQQ